MLHLEKITEDIHRLVLPFKDIYTTVAILNTPEGVVIFDAASYPDDVDQYILPALEQLQIPQSAVRYIVISHNHGDHAGGLPRFCQQMPHVTVAAGSDACTARVPEKSVQVLNEGDLLLGTLQVIRMPGHTVDSLGLLDLRSHTLVCGDSLQIYGIYGSGKWGRNIHYIPEHLAMCQRLPGYGIQQILTAHDYHPMGHLIQGSDQVALCAQHCVDALKEIAAFVLQHPELDDEKAMALYNANSGLPTVGAHIAAACRKAAAEGIL